jgi:hypothetical protein
MQSKPEYPANDGREYIICGLSQRFTFMIKNRARLKNVNHHKRNKSI